MEQIFVLRNDTSRNFVLGVVGKMPLSPLKEIEIRDFKSKRSAAQNRLYWAFLRDIAAQMEVPDENGELRKYSSEDWHDLCRMKWLGVKTIRLGDKEYPRPSKSTTKLKIGEFAEYLTNIEAHFLSKGVRLTFPDDYGYAMGFEERS